MGSADIQGPLWSGIADTWADIMEPLRTPLYEAMLDACNVRAGTPVLDVGCGSGAASKRAALRGAKIAGLRGGGSRLVGQYLGQIAGALAAAAPPKDVASRRFGPIVADLVEPGGKEGVPLSIRPDPQRLQIPTILAVMLTGEHAPKFGRFRSLVMPQRETAFASHAGRRIAGELSHNR